MISRSIDEYRVFQRHRRKFSKISDDHEKLDRIELYLFQRALIDRLIECEEYESLHEHPFFNKMRQKINKKIIN